MKEIRLELARNKNFPNGSASHGYDLIAPLDAQNHLDHMAWRSHHEQCRVVRFWGREAHKVGHLVHDEQGGNWAFHYDVKGKETADDLGFKFHAEPFVQGEYVSILEAGGNEMTYQVVSVRDVHP